MQPERTSGSPFPGKHDRVAAAAGSLPVTLFPYPHTPLMDLTAIAAAILSALGMGTVGVFANQRAHVCLLGTAQGVQTLTY